MPVWRDPRPAGARVANSESSGPLGGGVVRTINPPALLEARDSTGRPQALKPKLNQSG